MKPEEVFCNSLEESTIRYFVAKLLRLQNDSQRHYNYDLGFLDTYHQRRHAEKPKITPMH